MVAELEDGAFHPNPELPDRMRFNPCTSDTPKVEGVLPRGLHIDATTVVRNREANAGNVDVCKETLQSSLLLESARGVDRVVDEVCNRPGDFYVADQIQ